MVGSEIDVYKHTQQQFNGLRRAIIVNHPIPLMKGKGGQNG
jgi:hypothetical protein